MLAKESDVEVLSTDSKKNHNLKNQGAEDFNHELAIFQIETLKEQRLAKKRKWEIEKKPQPNARQERDRQLEFECERIHLSNEEEKSSLGSVRGDIVRTRWELWSLMQK